jgi:hypothetical protein
VHEQVVGLVIKSPLAHHQPCPAILALLHHVGEVLLLLRSVKCDHQQAGVTISKQQWAQTHPITITKEASRF